MYGWGLGTGGYGGDGGRGSRGQEDRAGQAATFLLRQVKVDRGKINAAPREHDSRTTATVVACYERDSEFNSRYKVIRDALSDIESGMLKAR